MVEEVVVLTIKELSRNFEKFKRRVVNMMERAKKIAKEAKKEEEDAWKGK